MKKILTLTLLIGYSTLINAQTLLFDNGSIVNSPGTGFAGADESVLQNTSLGMLLTGFGVNYGFRSLVEDFVYDASWQNISQFKFYAYQTASSTTSTFTGCYLRIWDGMPGAGGTIVFGDMVTNRFSSSSFANIYRVTETTLGNTLRPVMEIVASIPALSLTPGNTYYVEYSLYGTLGLGSVYTPAITITGNTLTGNALQSSYLQVAPYIVLNDISAQGLPFKVLGSKVLGSVVSTVPTLSQWGIVIFSLLMLSLCSVALFRQKQAAAL